MSFHYLPTAEGSYCNRHLSPQSIFIIPRSFTHLGRNDQRTQDASANARKGCASLSKRQTKERRYGRQTHPRTPLATALGIFREGGGEGRAALKRTDSDRRVCIFIFENKIRSSHPTTLRATIVATLFYTALFRFLVSCRSVQRICSFGAATGLI